MPPYSSASYSSELLSGVMLEICVHPTVTNRTSQPGTYKAPHYLKNKLHKEYRQVPISFVVRKLSVPMNTQFTNFHYKAGYLFVPIFHIMNFILGKMNNLHLYVR